MTFSHDHRSLQGVDVWEEDNGNWHIDYDGPGGDYRVSFHGPDAEIRAKAYAEEHLYPYEVNT